MIDLLNPCLGTGSDKAVMVGDIAPTWNTKAQLQALRHVLATLPAPDAPPVMRAPEPTPGTARQVKGEEAEKLATAYLAGATTYQLAKKFKIDRRTVSNILKRQGVTVRGQRLSEADVDKAERLYLQGLSLARVGERLGVSDDTVRYRLVKRGVRMRGPHERP